jgi:hypothetical protein
MQTGREMFHKAASRAAAAAAWNNFIAKMLIT